VLSSSLTARRITTAHKDAGYNVAASTSLATGRLWEHRNEIMFSTLCSNAVNNLFIQEAVWPALHIQIACVTLHDSLHLLQCETVQLHASAILAASDPALQAD
jgi:hypothetical protein